VSEIEFTIPGEAVPWARAGSHGKFKFTPAKQRNYMGALKMFCARAMQGGAPLQGPIELSVMAMYEWPKSWKREAPVRTEREVENLAARRRQSHQDREGRTEHGGLVGRRAGGEPARLETVFGDSAPRRALPGDGAGVIPASTHGHDLEAAGPPTALRPNPASGRCRGFTGQFPVITADPAYGFKARTEKGLTRSAEKHYRTLTLAEIAALPERATRPTMRYCFFGSPALSSPSAPTRRSCSNGA
jgi:hypothetical protein